MSDINVDKDKIELYDVKNASLKFRDKFSVNPLYFILDFFMFLLFLRLSVVVDYLFNEKYTLQIFSIALLLFVIYSSFIIYKNINDIDNTEYEKLVKSLDYAIEEKIKSNCDKDLEGNPNHRKRKLEFIEECSTPVSKQKDVLLGILSTMTATIILATLKMFIKNWNQLNIETGINYLAGLYLIVFIILLSMHLILSLTNFKLRILHKKALAELKLDTI